MNFKCSKCFAISSGKSWNEATVVSFLGAPIERIEDAMKYFGIGVYMYTCPICKDENADPTEQELN